jgi:hypothetical protein
MKEECFMTLLIYKMVKARSIFENRTDIVRFSNGVGQLVLTIPKPDWKSNGKISLDSFIQKMFHDFFHIYNGPVPAEIDQSSIRTITV